MAMNVLGVGVAIYLYLYGYIIKQPLPSIM